MLEELKEVQNDLNGGEREMKVTVKDRRRGKQDKFMKGLEGHFIRSTVILSV